MKNNKTEEVIQIPAIEFLDKDGATVTLDKILEQGDYWLSKNRRGDSYIVAHKGIEKIAKVGGIKPQINTEFILEVQPTYANAMNHQVKAKMNCEAKVLENVMGFKCIHNSDALFSSTGEASRYNTGARGGSYMRIMAEKRAYDRGVLQHLGINDKTNVYSEEEAESFEQEPAKPVDQIIEKLAITLNEILNATSKEDLQRIGTNIRQMTLDEEEKAYLRTIWLRKNNEFVETF